MKHISLAAKYRPQSFAEVVGQNLATTALSRAAKEDRVAPAYLFSGTRGVGKTTIARIFSKALNCQSAPVSEPCNSCPRCQRITAGGHVDVSEIDGASNTGVEDVRSLRENIGYLPMDGRYKVFIIDEAHMLSKSAFNALLKTLEEPPGHTVFIFATTEVHRFPATIVSRCQHFVFRALPQDLISEHLRKILKSEGIPFEEPAIGLIARRAAGSVRDSLSLLDQTLALSGAQLTTEAVRDGLGLAGQDFFSELFKALSHADCPSILQLTRQLFESGADLGFFTRELASYLRNLFLFRQQGQRILPSLGLGEDDQVFVKEHAAQFTVPHLHAAWQMILENQRSITQSPEPALALEMLLINLALLPDLLPVGQVPLVRPAEPVQPMGEVKKKTVTEQPAFPPYEWQDFCQFCQSKEDSGQQTVPRHVLLALKPEFSSGAMRITIGSGVAADAVKKQRTLLDSLLQEFYSIEPQKIEYIEPTTSLTPQQALEECCKSLEFQLCHEILGASILDCDP